MSGWPAAFQKSSVASLGMASSQCALIINTGRCQRRWAKVIGSVRKFSLAGVTFSNPFSATWARYCLTGIRLRIFLYLVYPK